MKKSKKKYKLSTVERYNQAKDKYEKYEKYAGDIDSLLEEIDIYDIVEIDRNEEDDDSAIGIFKKKDENKIRIELGENATWNWKNFSSKAQNIKSLVVIGCEDITNDIFQLKKLVALQLLNCNLLGCDLNEIGNLRELEHLELDRSTLQEFPIAICNLKNLQILSAMNTEIEKLPKEIGKLTNLQFLGLNQTRLKEIPEEIGKLTNLIELYLGRTEVRELPKAIRELKKLECLALWETPVDKLPDWICEFSELKGLYMGRAENVSFLPESIGKLKKLERFYIDGTAIKELPESFGELVALEDLQLKNTAIQRFPNIENLKNLKKCNLSNMTLERIPEEFVNSNMEIRMDDGYWQDGLNLSNTKLLCQPISLFTHEKEFIKSYYAEKKIHLNETKVVFLGDGEAGKSHIIERIKEDNQQLKQFQQESTPGDRG